MGHKMRIVNHNMNLICKDELSRLDREGKKGNKKYIQAVLSREKWDLEFHYVDKILDKAKYWEIALK